MSKTDNITTLILEHPIKLQNFLKYLYWANLSSLKQQEFPQLSRPKSQ
jgi:hypothetical protein